MNPRNDQELLDQQAEQDKVNAYANYHWKRGTGTWRAWEHGGSFSGQGAGGLDRYYTDKPVADFGLEVKPTKERK